ncbi:TPA_asm: FtsK [Capsaspora MELD virus 2]|nr:TPA_asm: FtsK [Capsaspora MELD virus 2]
MKNFYEIIPPDENDAYNPNIDLGAFKHPFMGGVVGGTGTGKTNFVLNLIDICDNFETITVFAKDLEEPLYKFLIRHYIQVEEKIQKQHGVDDPIIFCANSIDKLPPVEFYNKDKQNLIIFDDMICEKKANLNKIAEYFIRARKRNCSCLFLSQSYFKIPSTIRQQCHYMVLKPLASRRDKNMLLSDNAGEIEPEKLKQMFGKAFEKDLDVFIIDKRAKGMDRFRRNFTDYWDESTLDDDYE